MTDEIQVIITETDTPTVIVEETDPLVTVIITSEIGPQGPPGPVGEEKTIAIYESEDFFYVCKADIGTGLSEALWQVKKVGMTNDIILKADGDDFYDNLATDLSTVAGLNFL